MPLSLLGRMSSEVSGGELQRAALLRALLLKPSILILDEPTSMLDLSTQAQIWDNLRKANAESGMGMLLITHDLPLVRAVGRRMIRMRDERVLEEE